MPGGDTCLMGGDKTEMYKSLKFILWLFSCKQLWAPSFGGGPLDSEKWGLAGPH